MNSLKRIVAIVVLLSMTICTCSCSSKSKRYSSEDYIKKLEYKKDYRILQLCDIHLSNKDNRELQYQFMDLTISEADADLIVLDGDSFTFADKTVARELFDFIDSYDTPWAFVLGNHDEQCYFSVDWLTAYLNNFGSNCVFIDHQDDDIFGNSNYAINLMDGDDIKYQIILMDSNRYNYGEYIGYDYIKQNQIDWYERLVNYTTKQNNGQIVESIAFFHIPFPEFEEAWESANNGDSDAVLEYGGLEEKCSVPEINSGIFDKILELGSTKGVFVAHDHVNDFRIKYKGVYLCYGIHSTDRIYYEENLLGGQVITIKADGSLEFEQILHSYSEVE